MKDYDLKDKRMMRLVGGPTHSEESDGWNGAFMFDLGSKRRAMFIVSNGEGWEHVSCHVRYQNAKGKVKFLTPSWQEMCLIKELFWKGDETVLQYHPAESEYVNNHPHVLHLWRPTETEIPTPPKVFV